MKLGKHLAIPVIVLVGLSMIVSAGMIVSNVVEYHNHVVTPTSAVWIWTEPTTETPNEDKTDYVEGDVFVGTTYDFELNIYANQTVNNLAIYVEFDSIG